MEFPVCLSLVVELTMLLREIVVASNCSTMNLILSPPRIVDSDSRETVCLLVSVVLASPPDDVVLRFRLVFVRMVFGCRKMWRPDLGR